MTKVLAVTLCFGALVVSATGARSQNADFFAGKSITVVIGNDATMAMAMMANMPTLYIC